MGRHDVLCDPALLPMADALGSVLRSRNFTRHFSSPLSRAVETTHHLFPNVNVNIDHNLIERDLGEWSGLTMQDVMRSYPDAVLAAGVLNPTYTPPGGEPLRDVLIRIDAFMRQAVEEGSGHDIVAVTHNGIIRLVRCVFEALPIMDAFRKSEPHLAPHTFPLNPNMLRRLDKLAQADECWPEPKRTRL